MSIDEQHVALPKLYGAPAYARPVPVVEASARPFDPDDLPITAEQTDDERAYAETLPARSWTVSGAGTQAAPAEGRLELQPRPLSLKAIAGRLFGSE